MKADRFNELLFASLKNRKDIEFSLMALAYDNNKNHWFPRLASSNLRSTSRTLLIRAGIHGEEVAGPMTILNHGNDIFDYAHQRSVRLIVYPLGNPAGFEAGTRYSPDCGWEGFCGNNDSLRYKLRDGTLVDEITSCNEATDWYWSFHLGLKLPRETLLMHACLEKDLRLTNIQGVLDLHQDYITKDIGPMAYHYSFGNLTVYKQIIMELRKFISVVPINTAAGYASGISMQSDEDGFIMRHDGSLGDLAWWLRVPYNVTVETTGCTPPDVATKVNLVWIKGFVDLIANNH